MRPERRRRLALLVGGFAALLLLAALLAWPIPVRDKLLWAGVCLGALALALLIAD